MNNSIKLNAILNTAKQLCQVLFPLITVPYVSRILQTANYGKVNFGSSVISYFTLIAGLGINNYAIREGASIREDRCKLAEFQNEVFTINIYSTVFSYLLLFITLFTTNSLEEYRLLILVQGASMFFVTLGADWINSLHEDYFYITIRYIVIQIVSILLLFVFVQSPEDYIKFAAINVIASVGGNCFNIFYIRKNYAKLHLVMQCNLKRHLIPILVLFFNTVAVTIYVNSDMTILGKIKGDEAVGIYGVSTKIYLVVKQVLNAVIVVALPRLSAYVGQKNQTAYQKLLRKILEALIVFLFPCIIGLYMLSDKIILAISGDSYVKGYSALQILSLALGFAVLACFYSSCILLPNQREKICLMASIVSATSNILLNFVIVPLRSFHGAALTTVISEAIVFVIFLYYGTKIQKCSCTARTLTSTVVGCVAIGIVCFIVKKWIDELWLSILLSVGYSGIVYFLIMIAFKNEVVMRLLKIIRRQ